MPAIVLPAAEEVLIAWAKVNSAISSLVSTAIASALPKSGDDPTPYPFLTFSSDPGSLDLFSGENIPIIDCFVEVNTYAKTKPVASTLIQTVLAEIRALHETAALSRQFEGAIMYGGRLLVGPRPFIERDHTYERFGMDIAVTMGPALPVPP